MAHSSQPLDPMVTIDPTIVTSLTGMDGHTGMFFDVDSTNSSVLVRTNGTNALYVDKYQNVGVNNIAPGAQLDVNAADGNCVQLTYNTTANTATLKVASDGKMTLGASGSEVNVDATTDFNVKSHNGSTTGFRLNNSLVRSTADQLNYTIVTPGTVSASKAVVVDSNRDITNLRNVTASQLSGTIQTAAQPNISSVDVLTISNHDGSQGLTLGSTLVTATADHLNATNVTAGTASASKALVVDANKDITSIRNLTASQLTGTLQTAAQPNITSVGTLLGLDLDGTLSGLTALAIDTTTTGRALVVNSSVGNCIQLCYDNASGAPTDYVDMLISSAGDLSVTASGGNVDITSHNGSTQGLRLGGTLVTATADQINYLQGTTPGNASGGKALIFDSSRNVANINNLTASQLTGTLQTAAQPNINSVNVLDIANHNGSTTGLKLNGTLVTATATELNYIDTIPGTAAASKALVLDSSSVITGIAGLSATNLTGTLQTAYQPNLTSVSVLNVADHDGTTAGLSLGGVLVTATAAQINSVFSGSGSGGAGTFSDLNISNNLDIVNANGSTIGLKLAGSLVTATATQLNYNVVTPGTAAASKALVLNSSGTVTGITTIGATNIQGSLRTSYQPDLTSVSILNIVDHDTATFGLRLAGTLVTATAAQLNYNAVTAGTAAASKALVLNSSGAISGITALSATSLTGTLQTAAQPNITSVGTLSDLSVAGTITVGSTTLTGSELNVIDGITPGSSVVNKALVVNNAGNISGIGMISCSDVTVAGTVSVGSSITVGGITLTGSELNVIDGITPGSSVVNKALVVNNAGNISGIGMISCSDVTIAGTIILNGTTITGSELSVIDGVTPGSSTVNKALVVDNAGNISGIGMISCSDVTVAGTIILGGTTISSSEIAVIDGVTAGTAAASKALVLDSSSGITGISALSTASLAVGAPANSDLPVEIGYTTYQFSGAYAYSNNSNAHGLIDAGNGPSANYSLRADGRILVTGEVEITSDRRLKKDIVPLTGDMCKNFIRSTTPVRFNWRTDDAIPDYGYIAQDVLKAGFEDLVTVVPHPGMEGSVDEDGFINPANAKYVFSPGKIIPMLALNQRQLFDDQDVKDAEIRQLKERLSILEALVSQFLQKN